MFFDLALTGLTTIQAKRLEKRIFEESFMSLSGALKQ
jgi:hypothetical protein